jgi:hypothetical protein
MVTDVLSEETVALLCSNQQRLQVYYRIIDGAIIETVKPKAFPLGDLSKLCSRSSNVSVHSQLMKSGSQNTLTRMCHESLQLVRYTPSQEVCQSTEDEVDLMVH